MLSPIDPKELLIKSASFPLVDVRSPAEFEQGHIPGAVNIPLFSNEERAFVGTRYHKAGKDAALLIGLDFVGPKMSAFIKKANSLFRGKSKELLIYCWRGGMRSNSMAWLLGTAGYKVHVLAGGYKSYRAFIRQEAGKGAPMIVLGGMTGAGKTAILLELKQLGEQIIDLENLASHKGSVFGYLGQSQQPTNEQFENDLYSHWMVLDPSRIVWIEDESRSIGSVALPTPFFDRMKQQPLVFIDVPEQIRVDRLVTEYAGFDPDLLSEALLKIAQPLGGQGVTEALIKIKNHEFALAISLVLTYYDKMYNRALQKFDNRIIYRMAVTSGNAKRNAAEVLKFAAGFRNRVPF